MRDLILHNPRCSKSRQTLHLVHDQGADVEVVEYLKAPLSADELREVCGLLGKQPLEIVRTKEALFKELGLSADNGYSDAQWYAVLAEHPALMERPIVVYRGKAALGRPPENVLALFAA